MAVTETQVAGTELEKVRDKVAVAFEREGLFYSSIEKKDVEVISARDMRAPLELRPGGRFGHFNPAGGSLGLGGGPTWDKAVINTVHLKHGLQWNKDAEWATNDRRKAVINLVRDLLAKGMAEFRRNIDSLCMTGGDGVIGTVTSVSTASSVDTYTMSTDGFGARLMRFGQPFSVYNAALTTRRGAGEVTFIDYPNKQIKTAAVAGAAATDKIVVDGLTATPPVSIQGVPYHHNDASTGTWLGFDRATTPEIRANRVTASGNLALPFPRRAMNKIGDRVGTDGMKKVVAWMHPCQKQAYEELGQLVSIINKNAKEDALDLYFGDNMQMAGAPIKTSFSWDKTRIDFVVSEVWGRAEFNKAGFYEEDGKKIFEIRGSDGSVSATSIFYIVASFQPYVQNPAVCSYISDLTVPTGY